MKKIKYNVKVTFEGKDGKNVEMHTYASTANDLLKNLDDILNKKSKSWIMGLFGEKS